MQLSMSQLMTGVATTETAAESKHEKYIVLENTLLVHTCEEVLGVTNLLEDLKVQD